MYIHDLKLAPQVGNPETDDVHDSKGLLEYAWSHAVISDQQYDSAKEFCDFKALSWSNDCNNAMDLVYQTYKEIDIYNIYAPICILNHPSSSSLGSYANYEVIHLFPISSDHSVYPKTNVSLHEDLIEFSEAFLQEPQLFFYLCDDLFEGL